MAAGLDTLPELQDHGIVFSAHVRSESPGTSGITARRVTPLCECITLVFSQHGRPKSGYDEKPCAEI
jgi:hypothetical protein